MNKSWRLERLKTGIESRANHESNFLAKLGGVKLRNEPASIFELACRALPARPASLRIGNIDC